MKRRLKKCIKHSIKNTTIYKIVNIETGLFKEKGMSLHCTKYGGVWYKLGDVRKAFNLIYPDDREYFKIIELELKVTNLEEK